MFGKTSWRMNRGGKEKGFTLIELIIVMAILALLAALIVPKFAGILEDKDEDIDKANLKMLQTAVELYAADNQGEYPEELEDLKDKYIHEIPESLQAGKKFDLDNKKVVFLADDTEGNGSE